MEFPEEQEAHESQHDPQPESMPKHIMESAISDRGTFDRGAREDRAYVEDAAPLPMAHAADRLAGDVISLDNMRTAIVTNFEPDDLDVPAFLRKRNEVM